MKIELLRRTLRIAKCIKTLNRDVKIENTINILIKNLEELQVN